MLKRSFGLFLLGGLLAAVPGAAQTELAEGWDFVPGEKLLLYDDFTDMVRGGQPPHWKVRGAAVKLTADGKLLASQDTKLWPNVTKWPKNFTIEQDVTLPKAEADRDLTWAFGSADEEWKWRVWFRFVTEEGTCSANLDVEGESGVGKGDCKFEPGKTYTLSLWVQDGRVRVYLGSERLIDVNQVKTEGFSAAWMALEVNETPVTFSRFRIAESSPDFSKSIMASGRFVTHGIQFDVNSDRLKAESAPVLKMIAAALSSEAGLKLRIEGHTDSSGDTAKNMDLSKRRAEAVKTALVSQHGVAADRLTAAGMGSTKPISGNETPQGRADNRRVEFVKM